MKIRRLAVITLMAAATSGLVFSGLAIAQPQCAGKTARLVRLERAMPRLSAAKRAELKKIHQQFMQQTEKTRQGLRANMAMLKAEVLQPNVDSKKMETLTKAINNQRSELFTKQVQMHILAKEKLGVNLPFRHKAHAPMRRLRSAR